MREMLIATAVVFAAFQCLNADTARAARDGTLRPGAPAPALNCGKWLKGEPVERLEKGKIYVVEFWATWCGPCRDAIPHLSELQARHKEIIFIGQDCAERNPDAAAKVVEQMGEKMHYRVAMDDTTHDADGAMAKSWMSAARQDAVPVAFVVDKEGRIAWIGPPIALDDVLDQVIAGTLDGKIAGAREGRRRVSETISAAIQKEDYPTAWNLIRKLAETCKNEPGELNKLAWLIVDPLLSVKSPDLALAEQLAARACELTKNANASYLDTLARVQYVKGDIDKAIETETRALETASVLERVAIKQDLVAYQNAKEKTTRRSTPTAK